MEALAEQSGIGQSYLSEIETSKKPGSVSVLKALAEALGMPIDDVIPKQGVILVPAAGLEPALPLPGNGF